MCLGEGLFSYILVATWRFERPIGNFIGLFYGYFPPLHFPCVLFLELLAIRYWLSWTCPLVFAIFSLLFSLFYSEGFTHFSLLVFLSSFKFLIMFLTFNSSSILECFFFSQNCFCFINAVPYLAEVIEIFKNIFTEVFFQL